MGINNNIRSDDGNSIATTQIPKETTEKTKYNQQLTIKNGTICIENNKTLLDSELKKSDDPDKQNEQTILQKFSQKTNEAVQCIFLCEFHMKAGRKIAVQVPENYLSKENFETVSRYIIPQVQLKRSFLSVSLLGIKILGYPVRIDDEQYERNAFYFNICFVFAPATRTIGYEPVVRKLSEYLLAMEHSNKLLSQKFNPKQMDGIARLLTQIRNDINNKRMCMLQEGSTLIPLCVVPRYCETVKIYPHQAAALTDDFYKYVRDQWDLTTLRILPYIDGFNHVNRITALADVALELVCDCIRHLVVLGVAVIVPVFQYSNIYRPTPKLSQLAKCRDLQRKCVQKCSKSERQSASVRDVFRIFASMAHGATFGELCVRFNPAALNINEKQLVLFGQIEGLIRRVDKFPVTVSRNLFAGDEDDITKPKLGSAGTLPNTTAFETIGVTFNANNKAQCSKPLPRGGRALKHDGCSNGNNTSTKNVYNGLKSFDEICCATGMSCQQLDAFLARDKHVIVLLK